MSLITLAAILVALAGLAAGVGVSNLARHWGAQPLWAVLAGLAALLLAVPGIILVTTIPSTEQPVVGSEAIGVVGAIVTTSLPWLSNRTRYPVAAPLRRRGKPS